VITRWPGGMLTNYSTVRQSLRRLEEIEQMEKDGTFKELVKKEVLMLNRERDKLNDVFSGIRTMKGQPGLMIVGDVKHDHLAVSEARRLRIPVIALCDTNVDPELIDYPIPSNDDAVKAIELLMGALISAVSDLPRDGEAGIDKDAAAEKESAQ
jgi:small subunit ribosomal protein S2